MEESNHQEFTDLLTSHQRQLYRYITSLLGNADAAWDVLQETNRLLLEKRGQFELGTSFLNWSLTVAQFQTLAWLRNQKRDRLIITPQILPLLADEAKNHLVEEDHRSEALEHCLEKLPSQHRELLHRRYARSESLAKLAEQTGRTVNAMKQLFFRLRGRLMHCIESRLETQ